MRATDSGHVYRADQLALLDHLGIDRFHAAGTCIGGPCILGLIEAAPPRVASAVIFQTIGLDDNRRAFFELFDSWANELRPSRPEVKTGVESRDPAGFSIECFLDVGDV